MSPYPKPITADDLQRFRDAGADEVVLVLVEAPNDEHDVIRQLEKLARDFIEPALKL